MGSRDGGSSPLAGSLQRLDIRPGSAAALDERPEERERKLIEKLQQYDMELEKRERGEPKRGTQPQKKFEIQWTRVNATSTPSIRCVDPSAAAPRAV